MRVGFGGTTEAYVTGSGNLNDGSWHQVTTTVELSGGTTTMKIYQDGVYKNTTTQSGTPYTSSASTAKIGVWQTGASSFYGYFPGQVDDTKIYNYPLTSTQVKTLYNNGAVNFGPSTGAP